MATAERWDIYFVDMDMESSLEEGQTSCYAEKIIHGTFSNLSKILESTILA